MPSPNLLFIFTDQQRWDTLGAYGNPGISTPHLDRLAADSILFRKAYVSQPVCTPSRSTLMTGLYPHTNGCISNNIALAEKVHAFPEMMTAGNYETAYIGKWHLGDEIFPQHGFKHWKSIEDNYWKFYSSPENMPVNCSYYHFLKKHGFQPDVRHGDFTCFSRFFATRVPEDYSKPGFIAEETCRFIDENRSSPFILFVNFLEPHSPFFSCLDDLYDPADVILPSNFCANMTEDVPLRTRLSSERARRTGDSWPWPLEDESEWRKFIAHYWGSVSLVDRSVGRILTTLDNCDLNRNTIVVFTSDHGDMMGSHGMIEKSVMYEEAVRIPLILRTPQLGFEKRVVDQPISQVDLVPTLLSMMGQAVPDHLEGTDRYPFLKGQADWGLEDVFMEWNGTAADPEPDEFPDLVSPEQISAIQGKRVRTVLTGDGWKFNWNETGEHELYFLKDDPGELTNLYSDEKHTAVVADLKERIRKWQDRTGDTEGVIAK